MTIYVHDWPTWRAVAAGRPPAKTDLVLTESPLVYERLRERGHRVEGLVNTVDPAEWTRLADLADDLNRHWEQTLDQVSAPEFDGLRIGFACRLLTWYILDNCLYKGRLLEAILDRYGPLQVPYRRDVSANRLDGNPGTDSSLILRGCNYLALTAQAGDWGDRVRLQPLPDGDRAEVPPARPKASAGQRLTEGLMRLAGLPWSHQIHRPLRVLTGLAERVRRAPVDSRRRVAVFRYNPLAHLAALGLLGRGFQVSFLRLPPIPADLAATSGGRLSWESRLLPRDLSRRAVELGVEFAVRAAVARISSYLRDGFLDRTRWLVNHIDHLVTDQGLGPGSLLLTNEVVDPWQRCLVQLLVGRGVTAVGFAHGAVSRSRFSLRQSKFSARSLPVARVDFAAADAEYDRRAIGCSGPIHVQGTRQFYTAMWPKLARHLARRRWRIPRGRRCLIFATTHFSHDNTRLLDEVKDLAYWLFLKHVLVDVIGPSGLATVVKLYSKGGDDPDRSESRVLQETALRPNIQVETDPIFSQSRFAADLIMIDRPEATLDWALNTGIPLIYLNQTFTPLNPALTEAVKTAMFYVDTGLPGWEEELTGLLRLTAPDIRARWEDLRPGRTRFNRRQVLGPPRRTRDMVRFLIDLPDRLGFEPGGPTASSKNTGKQ
jgi:hypothetical protein